MVQDGTSAREADDRARVKLQNIIGAVHAIYITYLARWSDECGTADDASPADSFLFKIIDEVKKLFR